MNLETQMLIAEMPVDGWQFKVYKFKVYNGNDTTQVRLRRARALHETARQCPITSLENKTVVHLSSVIENRHIRLSVANDIIAAADDRCSTDEQREIRAALLEWFGLSEITKDK